MDSEDAQGGTDGIPSITLAEMLDDLNIAQDATGEDGGEMLEWTYIYLSPVENHTYCALFIFLSDLRVP